MRFFAEFTLSGIRFFAEFTLSGIRFFPFTSLRASAHTLRMTGSEGLRMT